MRWSRSSPRDGNPVLVGRFVIAGSEDSIPRPERYEVEGITKVERISGGSPPGYSTAIRMSRCQLS